MKSNPQIRRRGKSTPRSLGSPHALSWPPTRARGSHPRLTVSCVFKRAVSDQLNSPRPQRCAHVSWPELEMTGWQIQRWPAASSQLRGAGLPHRFGVRGLLAASPWAALGAGGREEFPTDSVSHSGGRPQGQRSVPTHGRRGGVRLGLGRARPAAPHLLLRRTEGGGTALVPSPGPHLCR